MKGIKNIRSLFSLPENKPAFLLVLLFFLPLILLWILEFVIKDLPVSFGGFISVHRANPSLWIADFLPFLFLFIAGRTRKKHKIEKTKLQRQLDKSQARIQKYTSYANSIGRGDYSITIETEGKEDELGHSLLILQNFVKANLKKENDQNWISEGKDMISRLLRIHNKIDVMSFQILKSLINYVQAVQGAIYIYDEEREVLVNTATYAYNRQKYIRQEFKIGQGLVGQCAYEMDFVYRTEIPDNFMTISSGILGDVRPRSLLMIPLITEDKLQGVIEFASLNEKFPKIVIQFLLELGETIARTIYNLKINQKTEILLEESRNLTNELRRNEETLNEQAEEMKATQEQLRRSNEQLEAKITEVENAQGKDFERLTREGALSLRRLISQAIDNPGITETIQYSFIKKEGERIYLESSAKNLLEDPAIKGIIINSTDITERIRAEKEERLKTRMQSLSENSLDMIVRLSVSGHFHYANPVVEDYIGLEPSLLLNKPLSELSFTSALHEYFGNSLEKIKSNPVKTNHEISLPVKMGEKLSERIMSIDAIPEFTSDELETVLFVGHDITEAKRIEKEIQIKNKNINDSINYAERIQSALLPDIDNIRESLPRSFIYYKPRDIVSGDFPYFFRKDDAIYIAAVDCTGHGVPGALLSFIGFFLLNNIVEKNKDMSAAQICDALHVSVRHTLKQNSENPDSRDGMDIAFCKINLAKSELEFAGAHRPLLLLSEGELTEYKGDRKSIGGIAMGKKVEEDFVNTVVPFKKSDKIFMFSDGITDQLGGPYGRKYSINRLRDKILENPGFTMQQYQNMFTEDLDKWQEGFKQLDDVLVIGIEF